MSIFIDMRSEDEFKINPVEGAINIPLDDVLIGKLDCLDFIPRTTRLEYYFPLGSACFWVKCVFVSKGFTNVHNRGDVKAVSSDVCIFDNRNNTISKYYTTFGIKS